MEPARVSARSHSGRDGGHSRSEIRVGGRSAATGNDPDPYPRCTNYLLCTHIYIAEGLLKAEGFTDVQYIKTPLNEGPTKALAEGKIDITQNDTAGHLMELDVGAPVVVLGGIHTGCWELFANDSVRTLRDLKGKTVAAPERSSRQAFVAGLATFVGLNPLKDITWINHEPGKSMQLFAEGKIDAFMGFAPEPQEMRAKKIRRVLIDFGKDRPWSQYFCCMAAANRDFTRKHPVATK